jgi:hypothetical protein
VTTLQVRNVETRPGRASNGFIWCIWLTAIVSILLIATALWFWGAREVRGDVSNVLFLTFIGAIWLAFAYALYPWFGLSIRDDALARRNPAALVALCSALLSTAITFAAGNLGEGPSYLENIFCAGLATGGLFLLWILFELCCHVSISIAEERDFASGMRFGGLLLSWGLILARATTGDWHSAADSTMDFLHDGWPAAAILMPAIVTELPLKPSRLRPFPFWPICGFLPALVYLAAAVAWLCHLGRWEGMPT